MATHPEANALQTHPSFALEDQEMARQLEEQGGDHVIVGLPSFASPDPRTLGGRLVAIDEHPLADMISDDFAEAVKPLAAEAPETSQKMEGSIVDRDEQGIKTEDLPENREEWSKANWQHQAKLYGLGVSGSIKQLQKRVEGHEAEEQEREDWVKEVRGSKREDLDKMAADYGLDPESYSNKDELAEAIISAEYGEQ